MMWEGLRMTRCSRQYDRRTFWGCLRNHHLICLSISILFRGRGNDGVRGLVVLDEDDCGEIARFSLIYPKESCGSTFCRLGIRSWILTDITQGKGSLEDLDIPRIWPRRQMITVQPGKNCTWPCADNTYYFRDEYEHINEGAVRH